MLSPSEAKMLELVQRDTEPNTLPTAPYTWRTLAAMGVDVNEGNLSFVDDGTHIHQSYLDHWGWWKIRVLGWYPYTDLRDIEAHERQGIGRPWLRLLPEIWQEVIFRELILLIGAWNEIVRGPYEQIRFDEKDETYEWLSRWLSLTNESWRRGADVLERELYESGPEVTSGQVASLQARYRASALTWRPMMPERAEFHRRYGDRSEYWGFQRA